MLKQIVLAIAGYAPCWLIAHCAVMRSRGDGLSLEYLVRYFKLAWSFSAGELPSFIWLVSLALYAVFLASWLVISRWHRASAA
jgi:hypothetical protein